MGGEWRERAGRSSGQSAVGKVHPVRSLAPSGKRMGYAQRGDMAATRWGREYAQNAGGDAAVL